MKMKLTFLILKFLLLSNMLKLLNVNFWIFKLINLFKKLKEKENYYVYNFNLKNSKKLNSKI